MARLLKVICVNCFAKLTGLEDEAGLTRIRCPKCGTVTISKVMGRRHIRQDIYAPKDKTI